MYYDYLADLAAESLRQRRAMARIDKVETEQAWRKQAYGSASVYESNSVKETIIYTMRCDYGCDLDRENGYNNLW